MEELWLALSKLLMPVSSRSLSVDANACSCVTAAAWHKTAAGHALAITAMARMNDQRTVRKLVADSTA